jgi:hypothetical protein
MSRVSPEQGEEANVIADEDERGPSSPPPPKLPTAPKEKARTSVHACVPGLDRFEDYVSMTPSMESAKRKSILASKELLQQMMHEEGDHFMMLHPGSTFAAVWNIFSVMTIAYIVIAVPFFMVFTPTEPVGIIILDIFIEVFFICDVVVNFRTG